MGITNLIEAKHENLHVLLTSAERIEGQQEDLVECVGAFANAGLQAIETNDETLRSLSDAAAKYTSLPTPAATAIPVSAPSESNSANDLSNSDERALDPARMFLLG